MDTTTTNPASTATANEDRMAHHLRTLADEAEALLKATARAGDEKVTETRERLRGEVAHLRERLADLEVRASSRVKDAAHRTDEVVHAHPYTAMGVAAAIGLLAGLLIGRR
jgi:ElaB/YqjD/DUF883 family membrane-anchored ribosome-binding protein